MYLVVVTTIATFIPMNFVFINSVVVMGACVRFGNCGTGCPVPEVWEWVHCPTRGEWVSSLGGLRV